MDAAALLGPQGPLAQHIEGFAPRPQQQQLAQAVSTSLASAGVLIAEAGTGTGKTFAYLVPALLSGQKVIVSTGTRNLQEQLFHKDLPLVQAALALPLRSALLKGRANYLCRYRLEQAEFGRLNRAQAGQLSLISDWARRTRSGDIAEVTEVPEDSPLWPRVTSTGDNCLGQNCPRFQDCLVFKARREAVEADVVVVNHHLLCADLALKEEGFGEVLPGADALIIDEAHQLPDIAGQFFGLALSSNQLHELVRDCLEEQEREAADFTELAERAEALLTMADALGRTLGQQPGRASWPELAEAPLVASACSRLAEGLKALTQALEEGAQRGSGLANCLSRCQTLQARLQRFLDVPDEDCVYWLETRSRGFTLYLTPLDVSSVFRQRMSQYRSAWIFTSATLAVGDDFGHFSRRLGLAEATTLRLESPFDYARNALLYHPKGLPEPTAAGYNEALLEAALPVLTASRGRAFILFTSHQALREAARYLEQRIQYPLLVQGSLPKNTLLERFRALGNAVLLGTASFWEGVDVRGEALSCVIIAKLPFAAPGDPVTQARSEALRRRGGNPFMDFQLPQAVITLKQGVGRLIRDVHDRGVLMLADPRLLTRAYGRIFLASLPPMARTRSLTQVTDFFATPAEVSL